MKIRDRKKKFSIDEERVLREKYAQHKDFLTSAFTNKVTNTGKLERWREIADAVNALGYESRLVTEVKAKWKNMASKAKETFNSFRKSQQETGGGLASKAPSHSVMKTIELLKDDTSFKGIDAGFSSFRHRPNGINPCKLLSLMASADESDDEERDESVSLNEMITTEQEVLSEVSDTHDYSEARRKMVPAATQLIVSVNITKIHRTYTGRAT